MESITEVHKKESLPMSPHSEYDREEALGDERETSSQQATAAQGIYTSAAAESLATQLGPLTSASFPTGLNALSMLPNMHTGIPGMYPGLDTLSMASALQSATLGLYSAQENSPAYSGMSSAPWSKYLNHITNRKRRSVPSDYDSDISSQPKQKRSSQGTEINSTSSSPPSGESPDNRDSSYWDRRRKNNEAAKRSRDARRQKEEEIAMRAAFLEQENVKLRAQIAVLKNESAKLHFLLFNRSTQSSSAT